MTYVSDNGESGSGELAGVVAFLTDFGLEDTYVGVMRSVVASRCPGCSFIDISHAVVPQRVRHASYLALDRIQILARWDGRRVCRRSGRGDREETDRGALAKRVLRRTRQWLAFGCAAIGDRWRAG